MKPYLAIEGGNSLYGQIEISGAKNAALPVLAATLLIDKQVTLIGVPQLEDVKQFILMLQSIGSKIVTAPNKITIIPPKKFNYHTPPRLSSELRASILLLAPLLARCHQSVMGFPGGCAIGTRPIDQHIKALRSLGVEFDIQTDRLISKVDKLTSSSFAFDIVSVTGTANMIMAAVLAEGTTIVSNIAREPEVDDLIAFLNLMGADIQFLSTRQIKINGVGCLEGGGEYEIIGDRIECGTYLCAAMVCGGEVVCTNCNPKHMFATIELLEQAGADIKTTQNSISLKKTSKEIHPINFSTEIYPGVATDMQPLLMVLCCRSNGQSQIQETIFENRYNYVKGLVAMGAKISISGTTAYCDGVGQLRGAELHATDLRGAASLLIAGLCASGKTTLDNLHYLDRGYERPEEKLTKLGAKIKRIA